MIKALAGTLYVLLSTFSFAQTNELKNVEMDLIAGFKPATIELNKDGAQISSIECRDNTKLTYKSLKGGYYQIVVSGKGQTTRVNDSVFVKKGQLLALKVTLDGPCLYDYPAGHIPVCPKNHTNNIIPIVYGLIGFINKSDSIKNSIHQGGCIVTGCDPNYYCTIHEIEF